MFSSYSLNYYHLVTLNKMKMKVMNVLLIVLELLLLLKVQSYQKWSITNRDSVLISNRNKNIILKVKELPSRLISLSIL